MKTLVVGDSYYRSETFARAFGGLPWAAGIRYVELDETEVLEPKNRSERAISEYLGTPRQVAGHLNGEQALVVHGAPVTEEVLAASSDLRLVCCARGGPVNVDLEAASAMGIPVVTTPGKNAEAVAELTVAFMLMLSRQLAHGQHFIRNGNSIGESAFEGARFFGRELDGQRLGLVGYGRVGRRVAERARSFGVAVAAFDPHLEPAAIEREGVTPAATLDELLTGSDFVSLHARAAPDNARLFGAGQFAAMPSGAYFINTARESLVDESALRDALVSGTLGGAALDVLEPTPGAVHPLVELDNVIVTPHIGGATFETLDRGARMLADELRRFSAGEPLHYVANRVRG